MIRNTYFILFSIFLGLFISGCTEEVEYAAKPEHLQDIIFHSQEYANHHLLFLEGNLEVKVDRTIIKPWINPLEEDRGEVYEFVVEDYKVKTEGNTYIVTGKGFEMRLERVAERMIKDESGDIFSTTQYFDEK